MKYKALTSSSIPIPPCEKKIIYIIPLSSSHKQYGVIYPDIPVDQLHGFLLNGSLELRRFRGCPDDAVVKVKKALIDFFQSELRKNTSNRAAMFLSGIILAGIGLFDIIFPDPIILLDELLIAGGSIAMIAGGFKLRRSFAELKKYEPEIIKRVAALPVGDDPLSSKIFASIQAKDEHLIQEFKDEFAIDSIENETKWYVDYIRIEESIQQKAFSQADLQNIMSGLGSMIPIDRMVGLENRIRAKITNGSLTQDLSGKLKVMKRKAMLESGFSEDAITVYFEFYRSACSYFASKGEKLI